MSAWKEKELSAATGKKILIKSIAQALPNYTMSVFKLTNGLCEDLMKAIRAYWWGSEKGRRKVQWIPWKTMVLHKAMGVMGFKDLILFNQALLAKQAWRLVVFLDSLCAKVLRAKYIHKGNLLDIVSAGEASQTWRAIEYGLLTTQ
jgi:ribosomal protein L10